ncbi:Na/Pi symporter [Marinobacter orientalis]|uniref:Na/Pi symporter n=1 Tax=Marinobacter orientalis TaxID=1928859 RepID=UPI001D185A80|nr:Na/Pi symporter [Marinobacter orientalis]
MNYRQLLLAGILGLLAFALWASPEFKQIASGVAIFLFGMLSLENGFRQFTGGFLERVLHRTTDTIPKSLGFGIVSTAVMQSSSLVSVITISFLSAGLLPLMTGIGIIFGANLGTTTGAWLFATIGMKMSLSAFALPMLVFGVVLNFQRSSALKAWENRDRSIYRINQTESSMISPTTPIKEICPSFQQLPRERKIAIGL